MKIFLLNLLIIALFPLMLIFSIWDGLIAFIKAFIKGLKDWSDML